MADEVEVAGLAELRDVLQIRLPEALRGKAMQAALAKAAAPMVAEAQARAPSGFVGPTRPGEKVRGRLKRAIYSYRNRASTRTYESRLIGVRARAWYWRFIEFGRAVIQREKGSLGTPAKGFFGKIVKAVPARPFLRPAFEANKFKAIEIVRKALLPAIEKVAAAARRRGIRRITKKLTGF
jgi:HK97 gp10 family phage protein